MAKNQADFTLTFRRLSDAAGDPDACRGPGLFADPQRLMNGLRAGASEIGEEPQRG